MSVKVRHSCPNDHLLIPSSLPIRLLLSVVYIAFPTGITEVQIIQWYVEEGAYIEEWKPLCQYQSDKAVDDVGSRVLERLALDIKLMIIDHLEI